MSDVLLQVQVSYRERYRQFYMYKDQCENFDALSTNIKTNIRSLEGVIFQIHYLNDEGNWITMSDSEFDLMDMFRCSQAVEAAAFRRIKLKVTEGVSPRPVKSDSSETREGKLQPRTLYGEKDESNDSPITTFDYKTPMEMEIDEREKQIRNSEEELNSLTELYVKKVSVYESGRPSDSSKKRCTKCHLRDNHTRARCRNMACTSALLCCELSLHPDENKEVKDIADRKNRAEADLKKKRSSLELLKLAAEKANSSFHRKIEPYLIKSDQEKYLVEAVYGPQPRRVVLNRDLDILEKHYRGKIPENIYNEASSFQSIINSSTKTGRQSGSSVGQFLEARGVKYPSKNTSRTVHTTPPSSSTSEPLVRHESLDVCSSMAMLPSSPPPQPPSTVGQSPGVNSSANLIGYPQYPQYQPYNYNYQWYYPE